MKVLLLQPPHWDPSHPYLSLPSLAAHLRARGHTVVLRDVALDAMNHFLDPAVLAGYVRRGAVRMSELLSRGALPAAEIEELRLLAKVQAHAPVSIAQIADACRAFRGEAFYDIETYRRSIRIVFRALEIVASCHFPSKLTFGEFGTRYRQAFTQDILAAMHDAAANPFIDFLEGYVGDRVLAEEPDLIGISFTAHSQLVPGLTLARILSEQAPDVPLVAGGAHITTLLTAGANVEPFFDYVDGFCCYGGEAPLERLLQNLESGSGGVEITPNFAHYARGKVVLNTPFFDEDLDSLTTPDFEGMPLGSYFAPDLDLPIIASKGCYWARCSFCGYCESTDSRSHFVRSIPRVIEDMTAYRDRHACRAISFGDDCMSPERCLELSRGLVAQRLGVAWDVFVRHDKAWTPEICRAMAESGCKRVYLGFESGSERVLRLMRKGTDRRLIERVWRMFKAEGLSVHAFTMGGFPSETEAEVQETIDFLAEHRDLVDSMSFLPFALIPPSRIMKTPAEFGVRILEPEGDFDVGRVKYEPRPWHPGGNDYVSYEHMPSAIIDRLRALDGPALRHELHEHAGYISAARHPALKGHEFLYYAFPEKRSAPPLRRPCLELPEAPLFRPVTVRLSSPPEAADFAGKVFLYDGGTGRVLMVGWAAARLIELSDGTRTAREIVRAVMAEGAGDEIAAANVEEVIAHLLGAGILVAKERSCAS